MASREFLDIKTEVDLLLTKTVQSKDDTTSPEIDTVKLQDIAKTLSLLETDIVKIEELNVAIVQKNIVQHPHFHRRYAHTKCFFLLCFARRSNCIE